MYKNRYTNLLTSGETDWRDGEFEKIKYQGQLPGLLEGRELLEVGEALHAEELTDRDTKFFRKPIAEVACSTVREPGQARLVEKLFDVMPPLKELDEIIERTRQEKDLPDGDWKEKKARLRTLLSLRDGLEPSCNGISELAHDEKDSLLKILRERRREMPEAGKLLGSEK